VGWPGVPFWNDALPGGSGGGGGTVGGAGTSGLPKLEGEIYVPRPGWEISVLEPAGNAVILVAPGRYYLNTIATAGTKSLKQLIVDQLNDAPFLSGTYAMTVDDDFDDSTGRVTVSVTGVASFLFFWSHSLLRDALGFTGTLFGLASYTSPNSSPHIWLPDSHRAPATAPNGHRGQRIANGRVVVSGSFTSSAIQRAQGRHDTLEFAQLRGKKCWQPYESVVNESFETFWSTNIGAGRRVRYHPNRAVDSSIVNGVETGYVGYRPLRINDMALAPEAATADWTTGNLSLWRQGPIEVINE
jgi:hypothetical protein